jgi:hypothetical protein
LITKGRLFDQVQNLYDRRSIYGGHLSQMKKAYNIKKLEKLIKHDPL